MRLAEAVLALGRAVVMMLLTVGLAITALRSNQKGTDRPLPTAWPPK